MKRVALNGALLFALALLSACGGGTDETADASWLSEDQLYYPTGSLGAECTPYDVSEAGESCKPSAADLAMVTTKSCDAKRRLRLACTQNENGLWRYETLEDCGAQTLCVVTPNGLLGDCRDGSFAVDSNDSYCAPACAPASPDCVIEGPKLVGSAKAPEASEALRERCASTAGAQLYEPGAALPALSATCRAEEIVKHWSLAPSTAPQELRCALSARWIFTCKDGLWHSP